MNKTITLTGSLAERLSEVRTHRIDGATWYEARDIELCFRLRDSTRTRKCVPPSHRRRAYVHGYRLYEKLRITLIDAAGVYALAVAYSDEPTMVTRAYLAQSGRNCP